MKKQLLQESRWHDILKSEKLVWSIQKNKQPVCSKTAEFEERRERVGA